MTDTTKSLQLAHRFSGAVTVAATTPATLSPRDTAQQLMTTTDLASIRAELDSLIFNDEQLAGRVRHLEKMMDTRATPLYKRIIFRLDGWPSWAYVVQRPRWRPWHKWWVS